MSQQNGLPKQPERADAGSGMSEIERESMEFVVVIVGAGPAGGDAQGVEAGRSGSGNKKPADHLHVAEAVGGDSGEFG